MREEKVEEGNSRLNVEWGSAPTLKTHKQAHYSQQIALEVTWRSKMAGEMPSSLAHLQPLLRKLPSNALSQQSFSPMLPITFTPSLHKTWFTLIPAPGAELFFSSTGGCMYVVYSNQQRVTLY